MMGRFRNRKNLHNNNYKNHTLNILLKSPTSLCNFRGFFAGEFQEKPVQLMPILYD